MTKELTGKARGAKVLADSMTVEERKRRSELANQAKRELAGLPIVTHGSPDHPLEIGGIQIPCFVLDDGRRVLHQRGMVDALGMARGSSGGTGGDRLAKFVAGDRLKVFVNENLRAVTDNPIKFRTQGGNVAYGYEATVLADICEVVLAARGNGALQKQQLHIAAQCEILMRGFARVGIIALIDEATGYQKDRERDALAKILEAFVAKELQPYIRTFDPDYYEYMFKLRGLRFPPDSNRPQYRPQYFGKLTNDIVYRRLAPGVLDALKEESKKADKKGKLFQHLTAGYGRQELLKHLGTVVGFMKISTDWNDFMLKLNKVAPRYNATMPLDLDEADS